jgi:hypothetical protein
VSETIKMIDGVIAETYCRQLRSLQVLPINRDVEAEGPPLTPLEIATWVVTGIASTPGRSSGAADVPRSSAGS